MIGATSLRAQRRAESTGVARPQLTSLVDMMVILLVFLLTNFSVDGRLVTPSRDLQLPVSNARGAVEPALCLEVTTGGINLDGARVAALPTERDSLSIAPLADALRRLAPAGQDAPRGHALTIHCDKRLDFAVIKRVLYTCSEAGCDQLSLLVLREDS